MIYRKKVGDYIVSESIIEKLIDGYDGKYSVDIKGNIYNLNYRGTGLVKKVKAYETKDGYLRVSLQRGKISNKFLVHRIVAEYFIENLDNKEQVNHKDGNKKNNNIYNLEWVTPKENTQHAYKTGLRDNAGKLIGESKYRPVISTDLNTEEEIFYQSLKDAVSELKLKGITVFHNNISKVCKGERMTTGGLLWKYATDEEIIEYKNKTFINKLKGD